MLLSTEIARNILSLETRPLDGADLNTVDVTFKTFLLDTLAYKKYTMKWNESNGFETILGWNEMNNICVNMLFISLFWG